MATMEICILLPCCRCKWLYVLNSYRCYNRPVIYHGHHRQWYSDLAKEWIGRQKKMTAYNYRVTGVTEGTGVTEVTMVVVE